MIEVGERRRCKGPDGLVRGRPEKVRIAHDAPADTGVNAVAGEVLGHRLFRRHDALQCAARLRTSRCARRMMNAQRSVERPITWEDKVWLSWAPRRRRRADEARRGSMAERPAPSPASAASSPGFRIVWLLVFFLAPFLIVLKISLSTTMLGQPPYEPVFNSHRRDPGEDRRSSRSPTTPTSSPIRSTGRPISRASGSPSSRP